MLSASVWLNLMQRVDAAALTAPGAKLLGKLARSVVRVSGESDPVSKLAIGWAAGDELRRAVPFIVGEAWREQGG